MKRLVLANVVLVTLLVASQAHASGFLAARFGGEHGHPTTDNPTAMYYNPAGLALGSGTRLYLDGTFAYRTADYERPEGAVDNVGVGTPADALGANTGKASLSNFVSAPFAGVTTDFGVKGLGLGLGFYAPFGGAAAWDPNTEYDGNTTYPGGVDGVQRWWSMDGTVRSLYFTGAGAYRIEPLRLSIGVGVNLVRSEVSTIRARNSDGSDDMVTGAGTLQEGRSFLEVENTTFSLGAGLIWEPTDRVWIGAGYQSQPGFGELKMEGTLDATLGVSPASQSEVEFFQSLPDIFRVGTRFRPMNDWEFRVFGEYVRWSVFERQCILDKANPDRKCLVTDTGAVDSEAGGAGIVQNVERNWQDAWGARAGASWFMTPTTELYLGAGYDGNAVPDDRLDPALMDMPKVTASLGARFELGEAFALAPTLTQVIYFEREIDAQARDATGNREGLEPPSKQPDTAGTYNQSVTVLNLNAQYTF